MSLVPTESGEVTPFDPIDFIQFAGIGGAAKGVSSIVKPVLDQIIKQGPLRNAGVTAVRQAEKELAPIQKSIGQRITEIFSKPVTKAATGAGAIAGTVAATTIPKQVTQTITKNGISTIDKALIGGGIASVTAITGLLTSTPGGQNLVNQTAGAANQALNIGNDISQFIKANGQIISIVLLIGAGALIIGAIKK